MSDERCVTRRQISTMVVYGIRGGCLGEMSGEGRMSGHTSGPAAHGMMYCWRRARASCVLATR